MSNRDQLQEDWPTGCPAQPQGSNMLHTCILGFQISRCRHSKPIHILDRAVNGCFKSTGGSLRMCKVWNITNHCNWTTEFVLNQILQPVWAQHESRNVRSMGPIWVPCLAQQFLLLAQPSKLWYTWEARKREKYSLTETLNESVPTCAQQLSSSHHLNLFKGLSCNHQSSLLCTSKGCQKTHQSCFRSPIEQIRFWLPQTCLANTMGVDTEQAVRGSLATVSHFPSKHANVNLNRDFIDFVLSYIISTPPRMASTNTNWKHETNSVRSNATAMTFSC